MGAGGGTPSPRFRRGGCERGMREWGGSRKEGRKEIDRAPYMESVSVHCRKASSPSKNISCSVVSAASSSSSGSSSSSSMRRARASRRGSRISAMSSIMAHDAAESVAPTNYYEGWLVRRGGRTTKKQSGAPGSGDRSGNTCYQSALTTRRVLAPLGLLSQ